MKWTAWLAGAMLTAVLVPSAMGQARRTATGSENGLLGIKLYDTGIRLLNVFGNPDEIQAVGVSGGGAIGPAGGGGGRGGFGGAAGAGAGAAGGGNNGAAAGTENIMRPFEFGDDLLRWQGAPPPGFNIPPGVGSGPRGGGPAGPPGQGLGPRIGAPGGVGGGVPGGRGAGPGLPSAAPGAGAKTNFTRWVYNRNGSKYGFILDKFNRVVQIEAIGLSNSKVKTGKGITFGSTFRDVMTRYQAPDGYEISGNVLIVRYLSRAKVAFRMSQLGPKKPHVVTGIVVAAAKG